MSEAVQSGILKDIEERALLVKGIGEDVMRRHQMWVLTIMLGISILIAIYYKMNHSDVFVVTGTVDAEESGLNGRGVLPLNGEWEFYWGQLLEPADFNSEVRVSSYMMVPGSWRKDIYGQKYPEYGCATYRIILTNVHSGVTYGIKKQSIRIASNIYVNGKQRIFRQIRINLRLLYRYQAIRSLAGVLRKPYILVSSRKLPLLVPGILLGICCLLPLALEWQRCT